MYWEGLEEDSGLNPPATVCEKILKRRVEAFVFIAAGHGGGCRVCEVLAMWLLVKDNSCNGPSLLHMMMRNQLTLRASSPAKLAVMGLVHVCKSNKSHFQVN